MKVDPKNLFPVNHYAERFNVSKSRITNLILSHRIVPVIIWGKPYIDISVYPHLPLRKAGRIPVKQLMEANK